MRARFWYDYAGPFQSVSPELFPIFCNTARFTKSESAVAQKAGFGIIKVAQGKFFKKRRENGNIVLAEAD